MSGPDWVATVDLAKVGERRPVAVYPKGVSVLLVKVDGQVHALANKCAHMGCPLEAGKLEGPILTCPCHDWRFDVRTGRFVDAPELGVPTFATRLEDGKVMVDVAKPAS